MGKQGERIAIQSAQYTPELGELARVHGGVFEGKSFAAGGTGLTLTVPIAALPAAERIVNANAKNWRMRADGGPTWMRFGS